MILVVPGLMKKHQLKPVINSHLEDINTGLVRMYLIMGNIYNIIVRLDTKFYVQLFGIPMGTNCADLFFDVVFFHFATKNSS